MKWMVVISMHHCLFLPIGIPPGFRFLDMQGDEVRSLLPHHTKYFETPEDAAPLPGFTMMLVGRAEVPWSAPTHSPTPPTISLSLSLSSPRCPHLPLPRGLRWPSSASGKAATGSTGTTSSRIIPPEWRCSSGRRVHGGASPLSSPRTVRFGLSLQAIPPKSTHGITRIQNLTPKNNLLLAGAHPEVDQEFPERRELDAMFLPSVPLHFISFSFLFTPNYTSDLNLVNWAVSG